jgi:hypothetical protein
VSLSNVVNDVGSSLNVTPTACYARGAILHADELVAAVLLRVPGFYKLCGAQGLTAYLRDEGEARREEEAASVYGHTL